MAEKNPDGKKLSIGKPTLSLKPRTETGTVRQSFSHGRSKQVVVEVKRTRGLKDSKPEAAMPVTAAAPAAAPAPRRGVASTTKPGGAAAAPATAPAAPAPKPSGVVLRT